MTDKFVKWDTQATFLLQVCYLNVNIAMYTIVHKKRPIFLSAVTPILPVAMCVEFDA